MYLMIDDRQRWVREVGNTPFALQRVGTEGLPGVPIWRLVEWRVGESFGRWVTGWKLTIKVLRHRTNVQWPSPDNACQWAPG